MAEREGDEHVSTELTPLGCTFSHRSRVSGRGGGIALIYRKSIIVKTVTDIESFQNMDFTVLHRKQTVRVVYLYRPPCSKKNRLINVTFNEEFGKFVCTVITSNNNLIILGDFNFYFVNAQDRDSKLLMQLLRLFGSLPTCLSTNTGKAISLTG